MTVSFEWDEEKARSNFSKHGITFGEAETVFRDPLIGAAPDPDHSQTEEREIAVGISSRGKNAADIIHAAS